MNFELKQYLTKKNLFGLITLLVILAAIPLGLYLNSKKQDVRSKATGSDYISVVSGEPDVVGTTIKSNEVQLQITLPAEGASADKVVDSAKANDKTGCGVVAESVSNDKTKAIRTFKVRYFKKSQTGDVEPDKYKIMFQSEASDENEATTYSCSGNSKYIAYNKDGFKYIYATKTNIEEGQHDPVIRIDDDGDGQEEAKCEVKVDVVESSCKDKGPRGEGCPCNSRTDLPGACFELGKGPSCGEGLVCKSDVCVPEESDED